MSEKCKENNERVVILIIDEVSMVGCHLLGRVSQRVRQITDGHPELPFGGCCVIFSGDPHQLDPVRDQSLYLALWKIANFTNEELADIAAAPGPPSHENPERKLIAGHVKPQRRPPPPAAINAKAAAKADAKRGGKSSRKGKSSSSKKAEDKKDG